MAESNYYDLKKLYRQAFGVVGVPYPVLGLKSPNLLPIGTVEAIADQYKKPQVVNREIDGSFEYSGALGVTYTMPIKLNDFQLWNEPLISLTGRKNVITTPIAGFQAKNGGRRRGSVKELISIEDYSIRIRGFIIDPNNEDAYPKDQVRKFRELMEIDLLSINCILTQIFNIDYICVTDFDLPDMAGYPGMAPYEITALSDEPFDFGIVTVGDPIG